MSRTPNSRKEDTHDRIVEVAAQAIRRDGYAGVGVADVMKEAGLTCTSTTSTSLIFGGTVKRFAPLSLVVLLAGCGAVLHGTRQTVEVQSSPSGAKIETSPPSGIFTTPATLNLERKNSYVLTFTSPGYAPSTYNITNGIGVGTVVADVLLTGFLGVVVDAVTGAWYGLNAESANVTLSKVNGGPGDADAIHISIRPAGKGNRGVQVSTNAPNVSVRVEPVR